MLLRYGNKNKTTKLQNVVIKTPPRKVIVEWIPSAWNDISCETIRKSFKSCALTTALDEEEDDQILSFKPEENPFVPILGDIAEGTATEILIDEDEEGDEEIDVLIIMMYYLRISYHKNAAKSDSI